MNLEQKKLTWLEYILASFGKPKPKRLLKKLPILKWFFRSRALPKLQTQGFKWSSLVKSSHKDSLRPQKTEECNKH